MKDSSEFIGVINFMKVFRFMNSNELKLFFNNKGTILFDVRRFANGRVDSIKPIGFEENE